MYNSSIPSTLRTWLDHILRPKINFAYGSDGPHGMPFGPRVIVIVSRGGLYSEGASKAMDFQEPYLRQLLAFIGITDVIFVRAEKINFGPRARDSALISAKAQIAAALELPSSD